MRKFLPLCFILLFSFCSKKEGRYPRLIVKEKQHVINVNTKEMLSVSISSNFSAFDFDKDTLIGEKADFKKFEKYRIFFKDRDTVLPRYNFKIIVDTSYTIPAKDFEYKNIDFPSKEHRIEDGLIKGKEPTQNQIKRQSDDIDCYYEKKAKMWKDYITCLPLLVFNNAKTPAYVGGIRMIQEAKDVDGKWKPIEFYDPPKGCIVNHSLFKHMPKKYEGLLIIKYHGSFKTKLRVKMQINNQYYYSNEFEGSINRSQFSQDYLKKYIDYHKGYNQDGYKEKYKKYTLLQYDF